MEIGMILKEAREAKSISLDDLQETTKIQKRYLIAIEQGDFKVLPGKFYARAFIKEYALAIGLDPNELLEDHIDEIPVSEEKDAVQYSRIQRTRRGSNQGKVSSSFSFIPTIIVVLLVIGIFFVAWSLIQKSNSSGDPNEVDPGDSAEIIRDPEKNKKPVDDESKEDEDTTSEQSEEKEEPTTDSSQPEFSVVTEGAGSSPESTLDLNNVGDKVTLTLDSDGETYLDIKSENGKSLYTGLFTPAQSPEEIDLSGEDRIYFNIGNATHLKITINGTEMEYPVDPNSSVHQKLWININKASE